MSFLEKWIEADYNPFILFNAEGRIVSLNEAAQFLLGSVSEKIIFEHATSYASTNFGFKTTHVPLEFGRFKFFAICVGYEKEDEIGIKLYRIPSEEKSLLAQNHSGFEPVNIYTLIDLCISTSSIGSKTIFSKDIDPTLPEVRLDTDAFIKLLNELLVLSPASKSTVVKLYLKIGEHIRVEGKKYSIFTIEVLYDEDYQIYNKTKIAAYANRMGTNLEEKPRSITMDLALNT